MHKETVSGRQYKTEKNVFDAEDIVELERLAAYLSVDQIAAYFCIGQNTFYEISSKRLGACRRVGTCSIDINSSWGRRVPAQRHEMAYLSVGIWWIILGSGGLIL